MLDADTALAGSTPLQPALPSLQQQAVQHLNSREFGGAPDNNILEGAADDEGGDEDEDGDDGEAEDNEEWEPAQTRTELLQDAVQYLQQASAEQQRLDELVLYAQDEDLPQVRQWNMMTEPCKPRTTQGHTSAQLPHAFRRQPAVPHLLHLSVAHLVNGTQALCMLHG